LELVVQMVRTLTLKFGHWLNGSKQEDYILQVLSNGLLVAVRWMDPFGAVRAKYQSVLTDGIYDQN